MLAIIIAMAFIADQRMPLLFGLISLAILLIAYAVRARFGRKPGPVSIGFEAREFAQL
jgi:GABA permease